MSNHLKFISLAHDVAFKNLGKTFPNPTVGCIITKNNKTSLHSHFNKDTTLILLSGCIKGDCS